MDFGHNWDSIELLVHVLDDAQSNVFDSQEDQAGLSPYNCHFEVALVEQAVLEMGDRGPNCP